MLPAGRRPHSGPGTIMLAQMFQAVKGHFRGSTKMIHDTALRAVEALDSLGHLWYPTPGGGGGFQRPDRAAQPPHGGQRARAAKPTPARRAGARAGGTGAAAGAQGQARRGPRPTTHAGRPQSPAGRAKRQPPRGPGRSLPTGAQPGPSPRPQARAPGGAPKPGEAQGPRADRPQPASEGRSERCRRRRQAEPDRAGGQAAPGGPGLPPGRGGQGPGEPLTPGPKGRAAGDG